MLFAKSKEESTRIPPPPRSGGSPRNQGCPPRTPAPTSPEWLHQGAKRHSSASHLWHTPGAQPAHPKSKAPAQAAESFFHSRRFLLTLGPWHPEKRGPHKLAGPSGPEGSLLNSQSPLPLICHTGIPPGASGDQHCIVFVLT